MNSNQNNVGAAFKMHELGRGTPRVEETAWHCFRKKIHMFESFKIKFNELNSIFSKFYELEKYENIRKEETN